VLVNARVQGVEPGAITVAVKGRPGPERVDFGLCVWSTGVGPQPLAQRLMKQLAQQVNTRAIVTDDRLRVKGLHNVFALGDCATIELPRLLQCVWMAETHAGPCVSCTKGCVWARARPRSAVDIFQAADTNHDGSLDMREFETLSGRITAQHPQLREVCGRPHELGTKGRVHGPHASFTLWGWPTAHGVGTKDV
jgi:hypothetical protein